MKIEYYTNNKNNSYNASDFEEKATELNRYGDLITVTYFSENGRHFAVKIYSYMDRIYQVNMLGGDVIEVCILK